MKHKTYTLSSQLSPEDAIARVGELLAAERVRYRIEGLSIFSTSTPIALLSFQRVLYSKRNWVGVNPFAYISAVNVECWSGDGGLTEVLVRIDRFRTYVYLAFSVCSFGGSVGMPTLAYAVVFVAAGFAAAWFYLVSFLGGYLLKKEIRDCVKGVESAAPVFPRDSGLTTQD
jgi:hypothetical protein